MIVSITPSIKLGKSSNGAFIRYANWSNIDISIFSPVSASFSLLPILNPIIAAPMPPTIPAPIVKPISVAVPAPIITDKSVVSIVCRPFNSPPPPAKLFNPFFIALQLNASDILSPIFLPKPVNFITPRTDMIVVSTGAD